jgi:hypothetical protein
MKGKITMKKLVSLGIAVALLVFAIAVMADGTPNVVGNWEGALDTPNGAYPILLHVAQKDGKFVGTLDSPEQNAIGLKITTISIKNLDFHFEVKSVNGTYDGKIKADGSGIAGEWKGIMGDMPLNFKRPQK